MNTRRKIYKIVTILLAAVFFVSVPIFVIPKISEKKTSDTVVKQGVLELWHIESFEGGSASRIDWLKARALEYEKLNKGLYIHITPLTAEQANEMAKTQHFDLISFSCGAGADMLPYLNEYNGAVYADSNYSKCGVVYGKQYAVPYMTGGYFLFALDEKLLSDVSAASSLLCGFGQFNSTLTALALTDLVLTVEGDYGVTQYKAYERFVSSKNSLLLGTQRDEYRLGNRVASGKLNGVYARPLGGFTDLTQFLALSADCKNVAASTEFIEYLTSDSVQSKLSRCNMISVCGLSVYSGGFMAELEEALKKAKTVNVFMSRASLIKMREISLAAAGNGEKKDLLFFLNEGGATP